MHTISLVQPDDLHLHLRDGSALHSVVGDTARQFARAIVMPNLKPPVTTVEQALAYRERILAALPEGSGFQALMTLYLTDNMEITELEKAVASPHVYAVKYYPAGATTNSDDGVTAMEKVYHLLEYMAEVSLPLLIHGEVTDEDVDIFDREQVFIDRILAPLVERTPGLRVVMEHITTAAAVDFVTNAGENVAATITPHHLIYNRNAIFKNGLQAHNYCLPVLKREINRQALREIVASGHPRFFLGTDSAPHARKDKESACGCAGVYSAHNAIELYAEVFEELGCLDKLEAFASHHGADYYRMPRNTTNITLEKKEWNIPESLPFAETEIIPFKAGERCCWKLLPR